MGLLGLFTSLLISATIAIVMLKAFLSFIVLAVVLVTVSFACVALTSKSHLDTMTNSFNTVDTNCLDHCLSVAANQTATITPLPFSLVTLIVFILLLTFSLLPKANCLLPTSPPWRQSIGKLLRHYQLAAVLIRD